MTKVTQEAIEQSKALFAEWCNAQLQDVNTPPYDVWLDNKLKPKDPFLEPLQELVRFINQNKLKSVYLKDMKLVCNEFKDIFVGKLNGTKGLDEAIEIALQNSGRAITHYNLLKIRNRLTKGTNEEH